MNHLIFAGATTFFSLSKVKSAAENLFFPEKIQISFIDANFMKPFWIEDFPDEKIVFCQDLEDFKNRMPEIISETENGFKSENDSSTENLILIPLTEFWISQCVKNPGCCRISKAALASSRSKKFFYDFMKKKGFPVPRIFESPEEAKIAVKNGTEILIKPDSLNSGYGIEIVNAGNFKDFDKFAFQALNLKNHATKLFQIENKDVLFCERICGTEYSADCFCFNGKIAVVRLCRKVIGILRDKPCCLVCELFENPEIEASEICRQLESWCKSIFENGDISFAQFDFIETEDGKNLVPIDFASRVGGGMKDLIEEFFNKNKIHFYAESIGKAKSRFFHSEEKSTAPQNACSLQNASPASIPQNASETSGKHLFQFNYLPAFSGYIKKDNYPLLEADGSKKIILKKKDDFVTSNPSSVSSRIAQVIAPFSLEEITEELLDSLLIKEDFKR